tara:strand:- start:2718 stop:3374 length:657 start_codon:yes stop_codon:yes gene_type:complete
MAKFKIHTRYKTKDKQIVPSVTTILGSELGWNKNVLMNWGIKMAKGGKDPHAFTADAADTGTLAHALCEANINKDDYEIGLDYTDNQKKRANNALNAFKKFRKTVKPKFLVAEIKLVSEKHRVGGTADGVFKIGDETLLYDIKTSKNVYDEMKVQLGMYTLIYEEMFPRKKKIDGGVILRLDKESGDYHYYQYTRETLDLGAKIFLNALANYRLHKEL